MWTLAGDLAAVTGTSDIARALKSVGICQRQCGTCRLSGADPCWQAAGDSYIAEFTIEHSGGPPQAIAARACTSLSGLNGVGGIAEDWAQRYRLLRHMGTVVPCTYWVYRGCIVQEHVPLDLTDCWRVSPGIQALLAKQLGQLCGVLAACRFDPVGLGRLRSHGADIVITDVGDDLGPPWTADPDSNRPHALGLDVLAALIGRQNVPKTLGAAFTAGYANGAGTIPLVPPS